MQNKTALIVDDSRTASHTLRRMLEREEFQVDVRGSAEEALGYLDDHRPGIIFMDHMMPGMDGFQAVKEIKSNLATANIPIVMYTAKSGDLYVGQVQALGAVDILAKPPTFESLRAIFRRIEARSAPPAPAPEPAVVAAPEPVSAGVVAEAPSIENPPPPAEAAQAAPAPAAPAYVPSPAAPMEPAEAEGGRVAWWIAVAAAMTGVLLGMQFPARGASQPWLDAVAWAAGDGLEYPHGEVPFGGDRVTRVRALVAHLHDAGFRGTIRLEGHAGAFCLVAQDGGWRLPDPAQPIEACEVIGVSKAEARRISGAQSQDFRRFVQTEPALADGVIRIEVVPHGDTDPGAEYPRQDEVGSAGDWNRIAARNNRIDVRLIPES